MNCFQSTLLAASLLFSTAVLYASEISYELEADYSYVGGARTSMDGLGKSRTGDVSEQSNLVRIVASPQLREGLLLRVGAEVQRYSFGLPNGSALPNTLQSTSVIVGLDSQISDSWLVRIQAAPGIYSDFRDIDPKDIDVPIEIGGSYLVSMDLQWIMGLYVDVRSRYPVLPGVGVRWKFADSWTLDAILPKPRLEYDFSKSLTTYIGLEVRDATYRVDDRFGNAHGNRDLNGAVVDYTEFRAGVGATWKINKSFTFEVETGYMPYRQFDFYRVGLNMQTRDGAPYGQVAISGSF